MHTDDAMDDMSLRLIGKQAGFGLARRKWRAALKRIRALPEFGPDEENRMSRAERDGSARLLLAPRVPPLAVPGAAALTARGSHRGRGSAVIPTWRAGACAR